MLYIPLYARVKWYTILRICKCQRAFITASFIVLSRKKVCFIQTQESKSELRKIPHVKQIRVDIGHIAPSRT